MSEGLVVRPAVEADLEPVLAILERWNMRPREEEGAERVGIDLDRYLVAELDGRIVGGAGFLHNSEDEAETASLAVDPSVKGKGVGYALHKARLQRIRELGYKRVRTETDRPETIRWYVDKFGYRVHGTNPKKHDFSLPDVNEWTVLYLEL